MGNLNWKVLTWIARQKTKQNKKMFIFDKQPRYEASGLVTEVTIIQCICQLHRTILGTQVLRYSIVTVVCMSHKAVGNLSQTDRLTDRRKPTT